MANYHPVDQTTITLNAINMTNPLQISRLQTITNIQPTEPIQPIDKSEKKRKENRECLERLEEQILERDLIRKNGLRTTEEDVSLCNECEKKVKRLGCNTSMLQIFLLWIIILMVFVLLFIHS